MIWVDELRQWPTEIRCFQSGACHLTSSTHDLDELHAFARRIGMRRSWFQDHRRLPHYDLTPERRQRAIELGAVFVPYREQKRLRNAANTGVST